MFSQHIAQRMTRLRDPGDEWTLSIDMTSSVLHQRANRRVIRAYAFRLVSSHLCSVTAVPCAFFLQRAIDGLGYAQAVIYASIPALGQRGSRRQREHEIWVINAKTKGVTHKCGARQYTFNAPPMPRYLSSNFTLISLLLIRK